jgi:hypothetical protein
MCTMFWRDFWKRRPALIDIVIDLCLGALIEFAIVPFIYSSPWPVSVVLEGTWAVRNLSDNIADSLTRLALVGPTAPREAQPFVFVDIGEQTWKAWGSQLITPRERLATLVDAVSQLGPAVVLLDVDLSFPPMIPGADKPLHKLLSDYGKAEPARAPLVLVRSLSAKETSRPKAFDERPTAYDAEASSTKIKWASTLFEESFDGLVRRWRLVEPVCNHGAAKVIPSAELAVAAIAAKKTESLEEVLHRLTPENCEAEALSEQDSVVLDLGGGRLIKFSNDETERRVLYSLIWRSPSEADSSQARFVGPTVAFNNRSTPLLTILPATYLLSRWSEGTETQKATKTALRDLFEGRIVIIGGSFEQSGDIHYTPVGSMPGGLIVVNAVHALLSFGTPHELEHSYRLVVSFVFVLVTSLLFHYLRPAVAAIAMATVLLLLMVATMDWFRSGLILDLAVPATGVLVHRQILGIYCFARDVSTRGWRALLAESEERSQ